MGDVAKDVLLKIEGLTKFYRTDFCLKKIVALKDLDLELFRNEIFGFLGPNGAGKSTTIKCVLGLVHPTSGKIEILGSKIGDKSLRALIGYLPENPYFYDYLTGREFLRFCGNLFKIKKSLLTKRVDFLLERLDLWDAADLELRRYSKGMKQRIGIAQALINDPELVFLDEPMSGLDPIGRRLIRETIQELKDKGKTIFLNSHIMSDVEMICDRVGIIIKGQLVKTGSLGEMLGGSVKSLEMVINVDDKAKAQLEKLASRMIMKENRYFVVLDSEEKLPEALEIMRKERGKIYSITPVRKSLEEFFIEEIQQAERNAGH